jgi:hypothetical protein
MRNIGSGRLNREAVSRKGRVSESFVAWEERCYQHESRAAKLMVRAIMQAVFSALRPRWVTKMSTILPRRIGLPEYSLRHLG